MRRRELLDVVLDRLLPPVDELGGAGALGLAASLDRDPLADAAPGALDEVLAALPKDFLDRDGEDQDRSLQQIETQQAEAFSILISVAYNAYYVDPRVLERIEGRTAYKAGPPQPRGYEIEPFDETLLAQISRREPFWRKVDP